MSEISIFSTEIDKPTYEPVIRVLGERGYSSWLYLANRVYSGKDKLELNLDNTNEINLAYNGIKRRLSSIKSAWFRHPEIYGNILEDKAKQLCLEEETSRLQESFWQGIPEQSWLNNPNKMRIAQAKISQLALANTLGFIIPKTVISNTWENINENFRDDEKIIVKMPRGLLYTGNSTKMLYTTVLSKKTREELQSQNPFPGIYQSYIPKARELRITIVGENVFSAAVYTAKAAKDDWRRHQFSDKVRFERTKIPEDIAIKCVKFLKSYDLLYGAFDFIQDNEGRTIFLECNSNGQFRWLEDMLDLPISSAIADELIKKQDRQ